MIRHVAQPLRGLLNHVGDRARANVAHAVLHVAGCVQGATMGVVQTVAPMYALANAPQRVLIHALEIVALLVVHHALVIA